VESEKLNVEIRGEPERMLFFRNCPPNDVIVVSDDKGYVYIFKLDLNRLSFFDLIKLNSGKLLCSAP